MGQAVLLTGCSGSGKSTLLAEMARRGWQVVPEPGRRVIGAARKRGGDALPWRDMAAFLRACDACAATDLAATATVTRLCDRGRLDARLGLARLGEADEPGPEILDGYAATIVLSDPWPELFARDADRRHEFDAALAEYEHIARWLARHAVHVLRLPRAPATVRADWWEAALAADGALGSSSAVA